MSAVLSSSAISLMTINAKIAELVDAETATEFSMILGMAWLGGSGIPPEAETSESGDTLIVVEGKRGWEVYIDLFSLNQKHSVGVLPY